MTSVTDRARRMIAPVKHLIDFDTPKVDEFLKELEAMETVLRHGTIQQLQRVAIEAALKRNGYNLTQSCRQLGIGRTTLYRKLYEYGLDRTLSKVKEKHAEG